MAGSPDSQTDLLLFALKAANRQGFDAPWDWPTVEATLESAADFAERHLAPFRAEADRAGCVLEAGRVRVPASFERAYTEYVARGFHLLGLPEAHGGLGAPDAVQLAVAEILAAADHSFQMLMGLTSAAAKLIGMHCDEETAGRLIGPMTTGETLATMCMTEADAGSDLGAIRTLAKREGDSWRLSGEKVFISGGSQSISPSILHMVLARSGTREDGRAALTLFAVPQSDRVAVTRIERKMGLHASPTCALKFTDADALLVGAEGRGLAAMFAMMDHARMDVAVQGVAHADAAWRIAARYASERVQGRSADGRPAAIADHGDVARMLAETEASTMGLRAMCQLAAAPGNAPLAAFLTPVCKAFATDRGLVAVDTALQVLGGYGYLAEYGIEQHWRDARITRIYEGANGIMAMTLVGRLLEADNGALADRFAATVRTLGGDGPLAEPIDTVCAKWEEARRQVEGAAERGVAAYAFLTLTGLVWSLAGWSTLAAHADQAPDPTRLRALAEMAARSAEAEIAALSRRITDLAQGLTFSEPAAGDAEAPALFAPGRALRGVDQSPLADIAGYRLRLTQLSVFRDFAETFEAMDITPVQYSMLRLIEANPGIRQGELAQALGVKRANMVAQVNRLEARGLASRQPVPNDRRSHAIYLTDTGETFVHEMQTTWQTHDARIEKRLGGPIQKTQLIDLLDRLAGLS